MEFWILVGVVCLGITVFCRALHQAWEQWYYGRLNRKTFDRWRTERR